MRPPSLAPATAQARTSFMDRAIYARPDAVLTNAKRNVWRADCRTCDGDDAAYAAGIHLYRDQQRTAC